MEGTRSENIQMNNLKLIMASILLSLASSSTTYNCPNLCTCTNGNTTVWEQPYSIHVHWKGIGVAESLGVLSSGNVTQLIYEVTKFEDLNVSFSRFTDVKYIRIKWSLEANPVNIYNQLPMHMFTDPTIFEGLTQLQQLYINVPTSYIASSILLPLVSLETLDLSDTCDIATHTFAEVYKGSELSEKPLNTLILSRTSNVLSSTNGFRLIELFPVLANSSVTYLDITHNDVISPYPGLIKYLPNLTTLKVGYNDFKYEYFHYLSIYIFSDRII